MAIGLTPVPGQPASGKAGIAQAVLINGPIYRTLLRLAAPNVAATLILSGLSVCEAIYVGRLGAVPLAAVALVFPLFMLANMLSSGAIGGAVSGATARALGANDLTQAEAVLRCSLCVAIIGGSIMSCLILAFGAPLYRLLSGTETVVQAALGYSNILLGMITVMWLHNMMASVLRGSGDMIRPAISTLIIVCSYACLAYLLIFGFGPIPAFQLKGAAIASVASYAIGAIYLGLFLLSPRSPVRLRRGAVPWSAFRPVIRNGLLASNQSIMTVTLALICTALIGRLGTQWMAGYGIGVRLELLLTPIIFGIGGALIAMTGASVGAGRRAHAIRIAWRGVFVCMCAVGAIGIVLSLHPHWWSGMFTSDVDIAHACKSYLSTVGPCYAFFGLGLCLYFASQGLESLLIPVIGTAIRLLIVVAGATLLLKLEKFNSANALILFASAMIIYGVFIATMLRLGPWSHRATKIAAGPSNAGA